MTSSNRPSAAKFISARQLVWILLLLILAVNFAIRWRLRDLPLERDEGEYAYAGQLLLQGIPPYQLAWNMKFPGTYFCYAGVLAVFGQSAAAIHIGLILVTSLSAALVFLIGWQLMNAAGGLLAAGLFVLSSALPQAAGLAGHATHFVVLFVCVGTFALLQAEEKKSTGWLLASGLAFGAAILMKQHAVLFALAAAGWDWAQARQPTRKRALHAGVFAAGIALPLTVTAVVLAVTGVWPRFVFWTIDYARQYVSLSPLSAMPRLWVNGFGPVWASGIWIWLLGGAALSLIFLRTPYRRAAVLGATLFLGGLAAAIPGFYFRNHYFLMAMPGLALLNAALVLALAHQLNTRAPAVRLQWLPAGLACVMVGDLCLRNGALWTQLTPFEACRKIYGFNPFPEAPEIARYLAAHTAPTDTVAVLGSEPEIFFLAHRHSASGYVYMYSLTEPQPLGAGMRLEFMHEIEFARPKYVVYANLPSSWESVIVPQATDRILDQFNQWWDSYATHYQLVGMVDQAEGQPTAFFWDGQLASRTNSAPANLSIFVRK
jgi:hypothetical protein